MSKCVLEFKVIPDAAKTEFADLEGEMIRVRVAAPPEKGKANKELIRFIAKSLGISKANLVLLSGETYRKKTDASEGNEQGSGDARFAQKRVRFHSARSRH